MLRPNVVDVWVHPFGFRTWLVFVTVPRAEGLELFVGISDSFLERVRDYVGEGTGVPKPTAENGDGKLADQGDDVVEHLVLVLRVDGVFHVEPFCARRRVE